MESSAIKVIAKRLAPLDTKISSVYVRSTVLMDVLKIYWLTIPVSRYVIPPGVRTIMDYAVQILLFVPRENTETQ